MIQLKTQTQLHKHTHETINEAQWNHHRPKSEQINMVLLIQTSKPDSHFTKKTRTWIPFGAESLLKDPNESDFFNPSAFRCWVWEFSPKWAKGTTTHLGQGIVNDAIWNQPHESKTYFFRFLISNGAMIWTKWCK